jgi:hypothetical protein
MLLEVLPEYQNLVQVLLEGELSEAGVDIVVRFFGLNGNIPERSESLAKNTT